MKSLSIFKGLGLFGLAALLLPSCGPSAVASSAGALESLVAHPDADGTYYVVESNESGASSSMYLVSVTFGRLIDEVYDVPGGAPSAGQPIVPGALPVHRDLLIGQDIENDADYVIETNPISRISKLTIVHEFGTPSYDAAFDKLFAGLDDLLIKDLSPSTLPPYSMVSQYSQAMPTAKALRCLPMVADCASRVAARQSSRVRFEAIRTGLFTIVTQLRRS